jgi:hypothetical protein
MSMYGDELHRIIENNSDLRNRIIAKIELKLTNSEFPNFGKQDLQENPTCIRFANTFDCRLLRATAVFVNLEQILRKIETSDFRRPFCTSLHYIQAIAKGHLTFSSHIE